MGTQSRAEVGLAGRFERNFDSDTRRKGLDYAASGRVKILGVGQRSLHATVRGTYIYAVEISLREGLAYASCTCPYFDEGNFCKHIWSVLVVADTKDHLREVRSAPAELMAGEPVEDLVDELDLANGEDLEVDEHEEPIVEPDVSRPKEVSWRTLVKNLQREDFSGPTPRPRREAELIYLVNLADVRQNGRFILETWTRSRLKTGSWGEPRSKTLRREDAFYWHDSHDRVILEHLFGAGEVYFSYPVYGGNRFVLTGHLLDTLLPLLCRTGRFFAVKARGGNLADPVAWDEGGPWELGLHVEQDRDRWVLKGKLVRGSEVMELAQPDVLLNSGQLFVQGKAARFRFDGNFHWIIELRRAGKVMIAKKDFDAFLDDVYDLPGRVAIELPEKIRPSEVQGAPKPFLQITPPGKFSGRMALDVCLSFQYEQFLIGVNDSRDRLYDVKTRRLILRDRAAEEAAAGLLQPLGFRPVSRDDEDVDFEIRSERLPKALTELLALGWQVEGEGSLFKPPGEIRISVTSGIDWFDLEGAVNYGDQWVPFPRLLAAVRSGQKFVKLGDGSTGVLPEEWLRRRGLILGAAEAKGDALRFRSGHALLLDALLAAEEDASCDETFRRLREGLGRFEGVKPHDPPAGFQGELRPYQRIAVGWMDFLRKFRLGGCLADDMGLGKTVTVLALLESRRKSRSGPSLVVVPKSLVFNWKAEAVRFAPALRIMDHTGLERMRDQERLEETDVVLTTYGTLRRDITFLKDLTVPSGEGGSPRL